MMNCTSIEAYSIAGILQCDIVRQTCLAHEDLAALKRQPASMPAHLLFLNITPGLQ